MKWVWLAAVAGLLAPVSARAAAEEATERTVRATATAYLYVLPEQENFAMLTAPVDIRWVHFEGRYNYEALDSGSAFAGVSAAWGQELELRLTPMIGGVFGALDGVVPALRWTLAWWVLDIYSESELVVDVRDTGDSFFYNWTELGFSPLDWIRVGGVIQRNRVFMSPLDIQRGLFVAGRIEFVTVALYEFNIGWTNPMWVLALGASF
jgi:hypothetical protein